MAKDTTLPIITHLLGYFTGFLGPLIVLLASTDKNHKDHAKRALDWQFSFLIYSIVAFVVLFVSVPLIFVIVGIFTLVLAAIALTALSICDLVFSIIAAVRASEGRLYEYPLSIRFFS